MTILLIRHAHTAAVGLCLTGRRPGVRLSDRGARQAARLPARLRPYSIRAIYTSPIERAIDTAAPLARERALAPRVDESLTEIDFGAWTGLTLDQLRDDSAWQRFNTHRSTATIPGGERPTDVRDRIVCAIERLRTVHAAETIAVFSHGDVIRSAVLHYLDVPLDHFERIEIGPASVTALELEGARRRFLYINSLDESDL